MGSSANMKRDYEVILQSIDNYSREYDDDVDILDYLARLRNMITTVRNRDDEIESILTKQFNIKSQINELNQHYNDITRSTQRVKRMSLFAGIVMITLVIVLII